MIAASGRLARFRQNYTGTGLVGVNIGANKDSANKIADYRDAAMCLAPYADYITVNVSSPNTPGLQGLQKGTELKRVLDAASEGMIAAGAIRPLVLKIAPDLDARGLEDALDVALAHKLAAVIITNTTVSRPQGLKSRYRDEAGGLSGQPLFPLSTMMLVRASAILKGRLPLIAAGGVEDAATAYAKILVGASLVQLYTGLAIKGALLPSQITDGLAAMLRHDGHTCLDAAVATFDDASAASEHAMSLISSKASQS
jgi:dihydroorotate dehydrogenase